MERIRDVEWELNHRHRHVGETLRVDNDDVCGFATRVVFKVHEISRIFFIGVCFGNEFRLVGEMAACA